MISKPKASKALLSGVFRSLLSQRAHGNDGPGILCRLTEVADTAEALGSLSTQLAPLAHQRALQAFGLQPLRLFSSTAQVGEEQQGTGRSKAGVAAAKKSSGKERSGAGKDAKSVRKHSQSATRDSDARSRPPAQSRAGSSGSPRAAHKSEAPVLTYRQLKAIKPQRSSSSPVDPPRLFSSALQKFKHSHTAQDQALALYVSSKVFHRLVDQFRDFVLDRVGPEHDAFLETLSLPERMQVLFRLFAEYVVDKHSQELQAYREQVRSMDLRKPYLWYPVARSLRRKLIYHAGPTNSGKTFTALQAMRNAPTGLYCGPLRLLAMEVYDELNASGTFCNLITGQERREVPGANHTSCTIEMLNTSKRFDVAVIDEIQLLGDENRGWAWTRALQGCPANEIHLCGDGSAIPLVKALAAAMNEPLQIKSYERFTPVQVDEAGLMNGYKDIRPGDCVVAFSRQSIYEVKSLIESVTGLRTCVVYGALPPETRRQQARLFNEEGNDFEVMVASNAVGMGLNLNIRRIIFTTLFRFEGTSRKQLSTSEMKQIAGRAGRRNSAFPVGYATCMRPEDIPILKAALEVPLSELSTPAAGLFPEFEHLETYASKALSSSFQEILGKFAVEAKLDGTYFFCRQANMEAAAKLLAKVEGLSLQERFHFCMAPLNLREPKHAAALLHFATRYAARQSVPLDLLPAPCAPKTPDELHHMEQLHLLISGWLWLSNRSEPEMFPGKEGVEELAQSLTTQMHDSLQRMHQTLLRDGQATTNRKERSLLQRIQALKQPLMRNLSWDAKRHFQEALDAQVKGLLMAKLPPTASRRERARRVNSIAAQLRSDNQPRALIEASA